MPQPLLLPRPSGVLGFLVLASICVTLPSGVTATARTQVAPHRLRAAAARQDGRSHTRANAAGGGIFGLVFVQDDPARNKNSSEEEADLPSSDELADLAFEETHLDAQNLDLRLQLERENSTALRGKVAAEEKLTSEEQASAMKAEEQMTAEDRSELAEIDKSIAKLTADRIQLSAEERKELDVGAHNAELKRLQKELQATVDRMGQEMNASHKALEQESAQKLKELKASHRSALAATGRQAEAKLHGLDSKLARAQRELNQLRTSSRSLREREASLENETADLSAQESQLEREEPEAKQAEAALKQQLEAVRQEHTRLSTRQAEVKSAKQELADEDLDIQGMRVDVEALTARLGLEAQETQERVAAKKELRALRKEYHEVLAAANATRLSIRNSARQRKDLEARQALAAESARRLGSRKVEATVAAEAWNAEKEADDKELQAIRNAPEDLAKASLEEADLREQLQAYKATVASHSRSGGGRDEAAGGDERRRLSEAEAAPATKRKKKSSTNTAEARPSTTAGDGDAVDDSFAAARQILHADAADERAGAALEKASGSEEDEEVDVKEELEDKLMDGYAAAHRDD